MEAVGHNLRSNSEAIAQRARRGFSLVEAAIVLAVVGVVIGGIWVAAANFYENYKVNKTAEDLLLIVSNIQDLISSQDAQVIGNGITLVNFLSSAGKVPKGWPLVGSYIENPYYGHTTIINQTSGLFPLFYVLFLNVPSAACEKIIVKVASFAAMARGGANTLYVLEVNYPGFVKTTFPITLNEAQTACNSGNNIIGFKFAYTRIN